MTLPGIPTVDDLAADPVRHHYDDLIAPAGLTNFLGTVRVDHDPTQLSAVTFPPVGQGLAPTATLFVDDRVFASYGVQVSHQWRPDRVLRSVELPGLRLETSTVCVPGEQAVAIDIRVTNTGTEDRDVAIGLALNARVATTTDSWLSAEAPSARNSVERDGPKLIFTGKGPEPVEGPRSQPGSSTGPSTDSGASGAISVQGVDVDAEVRLSGVAVNSSEQWESGFGGAARGGSVRALLSIAAGATRRLGYVQTVGTDRAAVTAAFDRIAADVPAAIAAAEGFWDHQLRSAFTPGNDEFSGHLPVLETDDAALRRLYWWGALGVIWFRRDYPGNVLGRSYDTLMPNYWATTTFIWDFSLSSIVHALLDPEPMRRQLEHWIAADIHSLFGTSSLTGGPVGQWYSVNDYALTRLVNDYVRFTADRDFLTSRPRPDGGRVLDHLQDWAYAWQRLYGSSSPAAGVALADYGEIDNLLECVSSYTHEVAGLNAANVWNLRTTAALLEIAGDHQNAATLRADADRLLPAVLELYQDGTGYFAARQPDGTRLGVRHCYDFSVVGSTIGGDLPEPIRAEMITFFGDELRSPSWLHALSPWDPDASFSVRPDHQWNGAYPAWPADAARALVALGGADVALDWLPGLARSANQGPPGQAHFVEEAMPPINGGARKAPPQLPYIIDWACSSAGAWTGMIIESLFGAGPAADGTLHPAGCVARLDPQAVLRNLRIGDTSVDVHADGTVTRQQDPPR
ncbi:glucosidase family protein [Microlunatus soli]|uniref:Alpha-L-rhamnosidase six-hairpin glycosidase domain-containing protein n=1 Tax=Microlunatus soli TaxID=630515 RepID=A0A1H1WVJ0_9ACTN|nr:hypothetical protein [Microlunatus soli]SDT00711.1 hypothetical protein SAMN04489812_3807 [Microlunatus soli]